LAGALHSIFHSRFTHAQICSQLDQSCRTTIFKVTNPEKTGDTMVLTLLLSCLYIFALPGNSVDQDFVEETYLMAHLEIKTNQFLTDLQKGRLEDMLSHTTGRAYELMFEFVRNHRQDPVEYDLKYLRKWSIRGSFKDEEERLKSVALINFKGEESYSEFLFINSGGKWKIADIFTVKKEDLPEIKAHTSEKELEDIFSATYKAGEALSEFRAEEMTKYLTAKLLNQLNQKSERKRYWGSMSSVANMKLLAGRKKAELDMNIEHKDARRYSEKWILILEKEWKLNEIIK
jgi:hypothetical protein